MKANVAVVNSERRLVKQMRNALFGLLHPGTKVFCVYCGKTFGKFLHEGVKAEVFKKYRVAGGGYKLNVQCPHCGSVDRSRLLYLFFELRTEIYKKKTMLLHISPNREIARAIGSNPSVEQICGSIEPESYPEFNTVYMDVQKIGGPDNLYDVVVCCHVIEHVENDKAAFSEIYRVLKPNGFAVLQVPLALNLEKTLEDKNDRTAKQRKVAYGQVDHVRLYGLDYLDRIRAAGFRVVLDNPFINAWLPKEELERHRLDPIEDVIVAHKDA